MSTETRTDRRRWLALYVLCGGMLMIVLDATIVNVALPSIREDLGFSQSSLAWVVNAYLISFGGLLLLAGRMGDLIGQRRIFLVGLGVFTGASLLCAVPHWIFFINVPIGIGTALLTLALVEDRGGIGLEAGADLPGAMLLTGGLMLGVYALLEAGEQGFGSTRTLALGGVAIALLVAFVARQSQIANPLMPLRLFRSRNVTGANVVMGLLVVGFFGMFFLGALYLQGILGYSPLEVGLAFLPACLVMGTLSLGFAERLIMGIGPRAALVAGLASSGAGLLLFARSPTDGAWVIDVLPVMLLLGLGAGLAFPSLMTLAMSGATEGDTGLASGLVNTTVQVGGAIGLAVLATLATERTEGLRADGDSIAPALNSGYHLAYLVGAALVVVAIVAALAVVRPRPAPPLGHSAEAGADPQPAYCEAA